MARYEESQIYRSSKPSKDDPTGDEGDSDGEVKPYSPMYRVYKFEGSKQKGSIENNVVWLIVQHNFVQCYYYTLKIYA